MRRRGGEAVAEAAHDFRPFSPLHGVTVAVCALAIVAICVAGLRVRGTTRERTLRRALGVFGLAFWVVHQVYWLLPANFVWSRSLPLHICDVAGLLAPLAMLTSVRVLRTMTYFWGLALSIQGFITPVITEGPGTFIFWAFWIAHAINVGYAIFDFVAGGFVVRGRDLLIAIGISWGYCAFLFALNIPTGWNYGYVGDVQTSQPTLADAMGPWPLRALLVALAGTAGLVLAWLPWGVRVRLSRER